MWDYVHPTVCHILLMTKPFYLIPQNSINVFLTNSCQASLILVKNRCCNSHMSCEPKISILEEYNFRLTFGIAPLWIYTQGPASLPLLKASTELPFRASVRHRLLFSFHFRDILDSSSLYLDFHVWEQEDLRKEVSDLRGPMLQVLAHKSRFCFRSSFNR